MLEIRPANTLTVPSFASRTVNLDVDLGALAIRYVFSTTITDSDPGNGRLRLSATQQDAALTIRADTLDINGVDVSGILDAFDDSTSAVKGSLRIYKVSDPTKWLVFAVTALASPSGYRNITVSNIAASETSPFDDGDTVLLTFTPAGDKGQTGNTGADGADGADAGSAAATRTALAALTPSGGDVATLTETGHEGGFVFSTADLSSQVAADPTQSKYVAPASDPTGASGAWVRISDPREPRIARAEAFGAIADGTSHPLSERYATLGEAQAVYPHATALTDEIDWCAIQAAINDLEAADGGTVKLGPFSYYVNKTPTITWPNVTNLYLGARVYVEGVNHGLTEILANGCNGFNWHTTWGLSGAFWVFGNAVSKMELRQVGAAGSTAGLDIKESAFGTFEDLRINGFADSVRGRDVLSTTFRRVFSVATRYGLDVRRGSWSHPNAISTRDCNWAGATWGVWSEYAANLIIEGGTVESAGTSQAGAQGGIRVFENPIEGGVGLIARGVYFEGNKGQADISILTSTSTQPASHLIEGCTFNRVGAATNSTVRSVFISKGTAAPLAVKLTANGFKNFGVSSASRPSVEVDPGSNRTGLAVDIDITNTFWSQNDANPTDPVDAPLKTERKRTFQVSISAAGAIVGTAPSGWSASNSGAGVTTLTHNLGISSVDQYSVVATSTDSGALVVQRVGKLANSVVIVTTTPAGTLTNCPINVVVVTGRN